MSSSFVVPCVLSQIWVTPPFLYTRSNWLHGQLVAARWLKRNFLVAVGLGVSHKVFGESRLRGDVCHFFEFSQGDPILWVTFQTLVQLLSRLRSVPGCEDCLRQFFAEIFGLVNVAFERFWSSFEYSQTGSQC